MSVSVLSRPNQGTSREVRHRPHRSEEAFALLVPVLERPDARADPKLFIEALVTAEIVAEQCEVASARRFGEQGVEFARRCGDDRLLTESLTSLCIAYCWSGEPGRAMPFGEEAVKRARRLGDDVLLGRSLVGYLRASDPIGLSRSRQLFTEAIACTERSGDRFMNYTLHNMAGCYALCEGDIPAARAHLEQAARAQQAMGESGHHLSINLGWVLRQEGDPDGARSMFEAGLQMSRWNGDRSGLAYSGLGLACLAADRGDWHRAGELHGTAQALLDQTGQRWGEPEARYRQESLDKVRTQLGQEQFDRVYARGTMLSLEEALDVVLGRLGPA